MMDSANTKTTLKMRTRVEFQEDGLVNGQFKTQGSDRMETLKNRTIGFEGLIKTQGSLNEGIKKKRKKKRRKKKNKKNKKNKNKKRKKARKSLKSDRLETGGLYRKQITLGSKRSMLG